MFWFFCAYALDPSLSPAMLNEVLKDPESRVCYDLLRSPYMDVMRGGLSQQETAMFIMTARELAVQEGASLKKQCEAEVRRRFPDSDMLPQPHEDVWPASRNSPSTTYASPPRSTGTVAWDVLVLGTAFALGFLVSSLASRPRKFPDGS